MYLILDTPLQPFVVGLVMSQQETSKVHKYPSQRGIEASKFVDGENEDDWLFTKGQLFKIYDINSYKETDPEKYERRLMLYNVLVEQRRLYSDWYRMLNELEI
jgi:hypothetical protein